MVKPIDVKRVWSVLLKEVNVVEEGGLIMSSICFQREKERE